MLNTNSASARAYDLELLIKRYRRRIPPRQSTEHDALADVCAVTFRPGDRTDSFHGKLLRPVGSAVMVALGYEASVPGGRQRMPLTGFRSDVGLEGIEPYGEPGTEVFHFDAGITPRRGARGKCLDPFRNPSLMETLLRLDSACVRQVTHDLPRASRLRFPRTLLGFPQDALPCWDDSPALRQLAARKLGISCRQLESNDAFLRDRLLEQVWHESLLYPGQGVNQSDLVLIDAALCDNYRLALRVFEDFSDIVGVYTWNPAREFEPLVTSNPAQVVLSEYGVDTSRDFCQNFAHETVEAMAGRMRELTGSLAGQFSDEEILDGLTSPAKPLTAWQAALPLLRGKLERWVDECVTDRELIKAAQAPESALFVSGASRVQVLDCSWREPSLRWSKRISADDVSPQGPAGHRFTAGISAIASGG